MQVSLPRLKLLGAFAAFGLTLVCWSAAHAGPAPSPVTCWWTGASGDMNWSTSGNWLGGKVPTSSEYANFDSDGSTDCIIDVDVSVVRLYVSSAIASGYGPYTHTIRIPAGKKLQTTEIMLLAGKMEVDGTLDISSSSYINQIVVNADHPTAIGDLKVNPGGKLQLGPNEWFYADPGTSISLAGTAANPIVVTNVNETSELQLKGNTSLSHVRFESLGPKGLQLMSDATHAVSAQDVTFVLSKASAVGSQHLWVTGAAWADYVFQRFSFAAGSTSTSPEFAVESAQNIRFRHYDVSAGKLYGDGETDQAASTGTVVWEPPDLVVTSVVPSKANPTTDETISVAVTVTNQGSGVAQNFAVDLFYNRASAPGASEAGDASETIASLAWGQSTVVTFTDIPNAVAGLWNMYASVDSGQAVGEWNEAGTAEGNNVAGPVQVLWSASALQPDLTITSITPASATPAIGSPLDITVRVENTGQAAVSSYRVDLIINPAGTPVVGDTGISQSVLVSLPAATHYDVVFSVASPASPVDWTSIWAIVDTNNTIVEGVETNNVFEHSGAVSWEGIDLRVSAVRVSDSTPEVDNFISIEVDVRNHGNIDAGAFDVALWYDLAAAPTAGANPSAAEGLVLRVDDPLGADATVTVTFSNVTHGEVADWAMYAVADSLTEVGEYNETNNVWGPVQVLWGASTDLPDLTITAISADPAPVLGAPLDVTVTVRNIGPATIASYWVDVVIAGSAPAVGTTGVSQMVDVPLAENASTDVVISMPSPAAPVDWTLWAIVDTTNAVVEADETNNVHGSAAVSWKGVDLRITSFSVSDPAPYAGDDVTVTIGVRNAGNIAAGEFDVALWFDPAVAPVAGTNPGAGEGMSQTVASLAAATTTNVVFENVSSATADLWSMYAVCDSLGEESEYDEANNVWGPVNLSWAQTFPDLMITSITPAEAAPTLGAPVEVTVRVENIGRAAAASYRVDLLIDPVGVPAIGDTGIIRTIDIALDKGAHYDVVFSVPSPAAPADWTLWAIVDTNNNIYEEDETNNVHGPEADAVSWRGIDLRIDAIRVTPDDQPKVGDDLTVEVDVRNYGNVDATGFSVALWFNRSSAPAPGTNPSAAQGATDGVVSLSAGATTTVTFVVSSATAGTWRMYAVADSLAAVSEYNETNNVHGPTTVDWRQIIVTAPAEGAQWVAGAEQVIEWTSHGAGENAVIEYTLDADVPDWTPIATVPTADGSLAWTLPNEEAGRCLVRVSSGDLVGVSGVFAIRMQSELTTDVLPVAVTPSAYQVAVDQPVSVEVRVRNAGTGAAWNFNVALMREVGGDDDVEIASLAFPGVLAAGAESAVTFANVTSAEAATWKLYAWVDPEDALPDEWNTENNISSPSVEVSWGGSSTSLRIVSPNGGESYEIGTSVTIEWLPSGTLGSQGYLYVSFDGGNVYERIDDKLVSLSALSYDWTVEGTASDNCRIRIVNSTGTVSDVSDRVFSISTAGGGALMYVGEGCAAGAGGSAWTVLLPLVAAAGLRKRRR